MGWLIVISKKNQVKNEGSKCDSVNFFLYLSISFFSRIFTFSIIIDTIVLFVDCVLHLQFLFFFFTVSTVRFIQFWFKWKYTISSVIYRTCAMCDVVDKSQFWNMKRLCHLLCLSFNISFHFFASFPFFVFISSVVNAHALLVQLLLNIKFVLNSFRKSVLTWWLCSGNDISSPNEIRTEKEKKKYRNLLHFESFLF